MRPLQACRTLKPAALGQAEDGPPAAVLHPVGCSDTESAVVPAGEDQIADTRPVAVGTVDLPTGSGAGEAVILGALVEPADQPVASPGSAGGAHASRAGQ